MNRIAFAVVLFASAFAGESDEYDPQELQGEWTVVHFERGGRTPPQELLKSLKVVIEEDRLEMTDGRNGERAVFRTDPSKTPSEIDLTFKEGPNKDIVRDALGIYALDGDTLKLAWRKDDGPRPKEFKSIPGERTSELVILTRQKTE